MEGGPHKADSTEFKECLSLSFKRPYILQLALSAGIGGLLFGYDTGVISGALLYIRDDFNQVERSTVLQETIVSMAVAGAIVGAALGGWMNDRFGRRISILFADILFFSGAIIMAVAPGPGIIILGRIFVGFGVGMASMTAPLYISEASPHKIRGALVSLNGLLITGGQFLSYLINLAFTMVPGTWRWMLGVAGLPALIQFFLMLMLPESPRWLYRKNRKKEAEAILRNIYPADEVTRELELLHQAAESEAAEEGAFGEANLFCRVKKAWTTRAVRRGLVAGILCQVAQQFCGINTVMYYAPTIVQLAGYASNSTALALSLITSGLNAIGSMVSIYFVDRSGRKKLMIISLSGIIIWLGVLSSVFYAASVKSPLVGMEETQHFINFTCPTYKPLATNSQWKCVDCLKSQCSFCANSENKLLAGACMANPEANDPMKHACQGEHRDWYTQGCPSNFGWIALVSLAAYIISYSPGMGTAPWIVNSEIYPLRFRGICGGMAAVSNWVSNLIVTQTFLSLTKAIGTANTFVLFGCYSIAALILIFLLVPETKGLPFEEVEKMLSADEYKAWKTTAVKKQHEVHDP